MNWLEENEENIEYTIVYQKNTKNGVKGEIKEKGFKIDEVCYKISIDNDK